MSEQSALNYTGLLIVSVVAFLGGVVVAGFGHVIPGALIAALGIGGVIYFGR